MTSPTRFVLGQWNFFCDLCGRKRKSADGVATWNNLRVCREHKEERNPQDFLRAVKDDQSVPWSRPEPVDTFVVTPYTRAVESTLDGTTDTVSFVFATVPASSSLLNGSTLNSGVLNG